MTQNEINAFYKDLGAVAEKHNVKGIAGLWISQEDKDNTFAVFDPSDTTNAMLLKMVVDNLNTMLRDAGWKNPVFTKGLTDPDSGAN